MDNKEKMNDKTRVRPAAYLKDLSGIKFIIEIIRGEKKTYALIVPPEYEIGSEADESLLVSAVASHYFIPYDQSADVAERFLEIRTNNYPDWQVLA